MKVFVRVLTLFLVFSQNSNAQMLPFQEVLSQNIGPKSNQPLKGFNINHFDWTKDTGQKLNCKAMGANKNVCPANMVFVCSEFFHIAVCVDQDLHKDANRGKPQGNMNLHACQNTCATQGKRIPTNNEWQVACTGTPPSACNTFYENGGEYPPEYFAKVPGHVCNRAVNGPNAPYQSACMTSQDIVDMLPPIAPSCVSEAGVRGCVGTFHQWVSDHFVGASQHGGFRFNGGSYVVKASAVDYVTPAHTNDFYHFGNGCRCATNPR